MDSQKRGFIPKLRRNSAAMRELDGIAWRDGIAFSSFGVRIGIRGTEAGLARSIEPILPIDRKPTTASVDELFSLVASAGNLTQSHELFSGAKRLAQLPERNPILMLLQAEVRRSIAERAPRRVFVHAGVVGWRGRAIVLPGFSMSGKSTLVAELVRRGALYYSDEYAIVDHDGFVHPFARPLSLRKPGSFDAVEYRVEDLGGSAGTSAIPIGIVAQLHFSPDARWQPQMLSRGQGLLSLISHSIAARRHPSRVLKTLGLALNPAIVVKGARGEASDAAGELLSIADKLIPAYGRASEPTQSRFLEKSVNVDINQARS